MRMNVKITPRSMKYGFVHDDDDDDASDNTLKLQQNSEDS